MNMENHCFISLSLLKRKRFVTKISCVMCSVLSYTKSDWLLGHVGKHAYLSQTLTSWAPNNCNFQFYSHLTLYVTTRATRSTRPEGRAELHLLYFVSCVSM
jgi:hypothetical protein